MNKQADTDKQAGKNKQAGTENQYDTGPRSKTVQSKPVQSNQTDVHPHLLTILKRRKERAFLAPIKKHTADAYSSLMASLEDEKPFILDSGCGTGYSSILLAEQHPNCCIIGIDRSRIRLEKGIRRSSQEEKAIPENCHIIRADCIDFWRLFREEQRTLAAHYILYPNPYPKKQHLLRRWHAHPVFPTLLELGGELTLRTNWKVYAKEFVEALKYYRQNGATLRSLDHENTAVLSPFEWKYRHSGHTLYEVKLTLQPVAHHSDDS